MPSIDKFDLDPVPLPSTTHRLIKPAVTVGLAGVVVNYYPRLLQNISDVLFNHDFLRRRLPPDVINVFQSVPSVVYALFVSYIVILLLAGTVDRLRWFCVKCLMKYTDWMFNSNSLTTKVYN